MRSVALCTVLFACAPGDLVRIDGSSCARDSDCVAHPSCANRVEACVCDKEVCWFDPSSPSAPQSDCRSCHGSTANAAPPRALDGSAETTSLAVGAHQQHLAGGTLSQPVSCSECHVVPETTESPGHIDGDYVAELTWGPLASANGIVPTWDRVTGTCINYCHGAAFFDGEYNMPTWNIVDGTEGACGTCHATPPAGGHPADDRCEACHQPTAGAGMTIADPSTHIDGTVDVTFDSAVCGSCHGTPGNPAPPPDLGGATASSDPEVGAHRAHLEGSTWSRPVPCYECHLEVDPSNPSAPGHYDTPRPAEVTFGALAHQDASPTWSGATCANTYCHGAALPAADGVNMNPSWTGAPVACGDCHGNPPATLHHQGVVAGSCSSCHSDTVRPDGTLIAAKHIDGVVDAAGGACDSCHGSGGVSAPPKDLAGLTVSPKVGAHRIHLTPTMGAAVACESCHRVPRQYSDPGHVDAGDATPSVAEVALGGRALLSGAAAVYTAADMGCTSYCHGSGLPAADGTLMRPLWDGAAAVCGDCHGMPPASPAHASVTDPNSCHGCHVDSAAANQQIADPTLHIDGIVQVSGGSCSSCHDGVTLAAAPPDDASHRGHANRLGFACSNCHGHNGSGPLHDDGDVDVVLDTAVSFPGGTTMANGGTASFTAANKSCRVGCHNPIVGSPPETPSLTNAVTWNAANPGCSGCHDSVGTTTPMNHDLTGLGSAGCSECHSMTRHTRGTITVQAGLTYTPGNLDSFCKSCHSGGDTSFGGRPAPDVSPYWTVSSHGAQGYRCTECHTHHSSTGGQLFVDRRSATCTAGCHDAVAAEFTLVAGGPVSHHRLEGGTNSLGQTISIACIDCHNPHLSQAHPLAAVDPDDPWTLYPLPDTAVTQKRSAGDYRSFCLRCHDGTPPPGVSGALNIAQALAGGSDPSMFRRNTSSQHRSNHGGFNCTNCHAWHGTSGTLGINRGRLLLNYMTVNQFSASTGYSGEGSCGTNPRGAGMGFGCH